MATGVGSVLTKRESVGVEGLLWVIKHSNELFHCVNEHGEFSGFSFDYWGNSQSGWVWIIKHKCRSSCAMKHKVCGIMDLF